VSLGLLGAGMITTLAIAGSPAALDKAASSRLSPTAATQQDAVVTPRDQDTRANLQWVFTNEVNAKQRYLEFAKQADHEGYRSVAVLFRACARAEQAHADQHVHAIAWNGAEARAVLDRMAVRGTEENLKVSLDQEIYEATQLYPSMIDRARADRQAMAVRSANYAMSAEREHAGLMAAALASLAACPPASPLYVCPVCGKTVRSVDFAKCPNCFTPAKRFVKEI
jgi:rubrerythrin